jgi:hypothetical protein
VQEIHDHYDELPKNYKDQLHKAHAHILNHIVTFIALSFKLDTYCLLVFIEFKNIVIARYIISIDTNIKGDKLMQILKN